ncbi:MAG: hypothetical protein PHX87_03890 [Candidatus Peribacteraceae bacterium]|nr:hypothetical protein [Candidatus Peribacteraceae bacterium]MDD5742545.1 hypothetical protein [Candidatus Peribacteraceae bacterium]
MSSEREPSWSSLPPHLQTSKLAHAICPEGAAEAAHNFDETLFWGRYGFQNLSRAELGACIWSKWGSQLADWPDEQVLAWMKHMGFRDHDALEGMRDDEVIRLIRRNEAIVTHMIERYPRSDDFHANIGKPSTDPEALRQQVRQVFAEDPELRFALVAALEHPEDVPGLTLPSEA